MQLNDFYQKLGGDYEEVKSRLLTDARIYKYLMKFPASPDFESLQQALAENNWDLAFRFSHNIKGICLNLGLRSLYEPSNALCENLRGGSPKEDCAPMMTLVEEKYKETIAAISELDT